MEVIELTEEVYGGEEGIQTILNNYYEAAIRELPVDDQLKARKFIEEALIVEGRRVGIPAGIEESRYSVHPDLRDVLLEKRLIRSEITHLGKNFEVSHDVMVEAISASYEERRKKEEEERRLAELRKNRRRIVQLTAAVFILLALIGATTISLFYARQARQDLKLEKEEVAAAKQKLEESFIELNKRIFETAQSRYNQFVAEGEAAMASNNYDEAIDKFRLAINELDDYAQASNDSLANLIDKRGAKADSLKEAAIRLGGRKEQFDKLMQKGEQLEQLGDAYLVAAELQYRLARNLNYNNPLVDAKLTAIKGKKELAFERFVKAGDTYFKAKGWADALKRYLEAQRINPRDQKVNQRIRTCRQHLNE